MLGTSLGTDLLCEVALFLPKWPPQGHLCIFWRNRVLLRMPCWLVHYAQGHLHFGLSVADCIRRLGLSPEEMKKVKWNFGSDVSCLCKLLRVLWLSLQHSKHQLRNADHPFYNTVRRKNGVNCAVIADFSRNLKYLTDSQLTFWLCGSFKPGLLWYLILSIGQGGIECKWSNPSLWHIYLQEVTWQTGFRKAQICLVFLIDKASVAFPGHLNMH